MIEVARPSLLRCSPFTDLASLTAFVLRQYPPILAGIDKFLHLLTNWEKYLAPAFARLSPIPPHSLMLVIGMVEIIAGVVVAFKPRIGAYIVAVWLLGIIINLLVLGDFYDVALRDLGLLLGALALARISTAFDK